MALRNEIKTLKNIVDKYKSEYKAEHNDELKIKIKTIVCETHYPLNKKETEFGYDISYRFDIFLNNKNNDTIHGFESQLKIDIKKNRTWNVYSIKEIGTNYSKKLSFALTENYAKTIAPNRAHRITNILCTYLPAEKTPTIKK